MVTYQSVMEILLDSYKCYYCYSNQTELHELSNHLSLDGITKKTLVKLLIPQDFFTMVNFVMKYHTTNQ